MGACASSPDARTVTEVHEDVSSAHQGMAALPGSHYETCTPRRAHHIPPVALTHQRVGSTSPAVVPRGAGCCLGLQVTTWKPHCPGGGRAQNSSTGGEGMSYGQRKGFPRTIPCTRPFIHECTQQRALGVSCVQGRGASCQHGVRRGAFLELWPRAHLASSEVECVWQTHSPLQGTLCLGD